MIVLLSLKRYKRKVLNLVILVLLENIEDPVTLTDVSFPFKSILTIADGILSNTAAYDQGRAACSRG